MINWAAVSAVVSCVALACSALVILLGYAVSNKIINNDLVHVQEALERIEKAFEAHRVSTERETKEIGRSIALIQGRCNERHKSGE